MGADGKKSGFIAIENDNEFECLSQPSTATSPLIHDVLSHP